MDKLSQIGRFLLDNKLEMRARTRAGKFIVYLVEPAGDVHRGIKDTLSDALLEALERRALSAPRGRASA